MVSPCTMPAISRTFQPLLRLDHWTWPLATPSFTHRIRLSRKSGSFAVAPPSQRSQPASSGSSGGCSLAWAGAVTAARPKVAAANVRQIAMPRACHGCGSTAAMRAVVVVAVAWLIACKGGDKGGGFVATGSAGAGAGTGSGSGSATDVVKTLDTKCLAKDWEACRNLGVLYSEGAAVTADPKRAAALFLQACDGGNAAACNNLGLVLAEGIGVVQDPAAARERYQKACDGDNLLGCRNLGLLLDGTRGIPADPAAAAIAFAKACDGKLPFACTN